jgi:hypothetical protein
MFEVMSMRRTMKEKTVLFIKRHSNIVKGVKNE